MNAPARTPWTRRLLTAAGGAGLLLLLAGWPTSGSNDVSPRV